MVNMRMKKFRESDKIFIMSKLCRKQECKGVPAFHSKNVIYYLKPEF